MNTKKWIEKRSTWIAEIFHAPISDIRFFRAPGRVNLIGEHTDYNDGFVLPVAIDRATTIAARIRKDNIVRVYSVNQDDWGEFDLTLPGPIRRGYWLNYVEGVARVLQSNGHVLRGADIILESDVPVGAGLSSSAALEIATAYTLLSLSNETIDRREMALACQRAEHEYTGANVGIMDQFISAMGEENTALLIDCRSLDAKKIHVDTSARALLICDTGIKHDLAASAYNTRRHECEESVEILSRSLSGIKSLRDVSLRQFHAYEDTLPETLRKRARHVISENERTLTAASAIKSGDFDKLSTLMYASHESLKNDYEVSASELDLLVDTARTIPGVQGTRMTGGGFGGCTVSFVKHDFISMFSDRMANIYTEQTGLPLAIYNCEIVNGAEEVASNKA
ncbi:MAG TPA: galactokinase [Candidatus Kapabacteria bacterium]|jgi:galactokinase|nr:galactokinase [Candidatus Kapabacteria bacterium]